MSQFDDELRSAFQREAAPDGFAERVMARLPERRNVIAMPRRQWSPSWRAAVAAMVIAAVGAGTYEHHRVEQAEGERAKEQLVFALEIATEKLQKTQAKVFRNSEGRL
ncbi:MAG TPA: hypothetical protein VEQ63_02355 [Bryobacteraceae bacterium]|nr:hypothetical protein [Bryobacteraceae bacterium]